MARPDVGAVLSVAASDIVIVDSSAVRNFVAAGAQRAFAGFLGDRVRLTVDVARELEDAASSLPGLRMLLKGWPPHAPVDLPDHLKQKAADILGFIADDPHASLQDLGEVTSVLLSQTCGTARILPRPAGFASWIRRR